MDGVEGSWNIDQAERASDISGFSSAKATPNERGRQQARSTRSCKRLVPCIQAVRLTSGYGPPTAEPVGGSPLNAFGPDSGDGTASMRQGRD
jgi:hypothetical protein